MVNRATVHLSPGVIQASNIQLVLQISIRGRARAKDRNHLSLHPLCTQLAHRLEGKLGPWRVSQGEYG